MTKTYTEFLESKKITSPSHGIEPPEKLNPMLFDFQKAIVSWALRKGRAAVFADCGLGKTPMQLTWASHVPGRVLILAPLAVSKQTIREGKKFGVPVSYAERGENVKAKITITNYERIDNFDFSEFGGIVLDECFTPNTMVDILYNKTLRRKQISDIKPGDHILNACGVDYVKATKKRRINRAVHIIARGEFTCSENHPFLTLHGWKPARYLRPSDYIMETRTAMCLVREGILPKEISVWEKLHSGTKNAEILRKILLSEMANEPKRNSGKSSYKRGTRKDWEEKERMVQEGVTNSAERIGENSEFKSNEKRVYQKKSLSNPTSYGAQTTYSRRKWNRPNHATRISIQGSIKRLGSRASNITGEEKKKLSNLLQGRFRQQKIEDCNRNRWQGSCFTERGGQEKRRYAGFIRVESVEVLEQSSPRLDKYRDEKGDIYFYDIEAIRHPSFSVNGVLVHNSSVLKSYDGIFRNKIISESQQIPFRLACTATPAPNDYMELGNHVEFLGVMTYTEMLSTFFVHDSGQVQKWRLKRHAEKRFWEWVCSWAVNMRKPSDLGYDDDGFILPPLKIHQEKVKARNTKMSGFFHTVALSLQERQKGRKDSIHERVARCAELVNDSKESWLIWCNLNSESQMATKAIPGAVEITGSDSAEYKEKTMLDFSDGKERILVTKPSIAGFGMNWEHCSNVIFLGLSDSYEQFYQAVRRCWRFGQKKEVNVYIVTAESEGAVVMNVLRKEMEADKMAKEMINNTSEISRKEIKKTKRESTEYKTDSKKGKNWEMRLGDCIEEMAKIKSDSIHYSIFSPPFSQLYVYSSSPRDMGNSKTHNEFIEHFKFLTKDLLRVTMPGRLLSFHCMNLPTLKSRDGVIGLRDFRGELIRLFKEVGWIHHSEVCIWKDPVTAMQRTKALGLLHKQLKKDSAMCCQGIPDYLITMRKPGGNPERVTHTNESFPVSVWQHYASPIWTDIKQSDVLQFRSAREHQDEKHICPLQLEVIRRAMKLWTNEGDLILSPFAGIGSEGFVALECKRKFLGIELKESYYIQACKNLLAAKPRATGFFGEELK